MRYFTNKPATDFFQKMFYFFLTAVVSSIASIWGTKKILDAGYQGEINTLRKSLKHETELRIEAENRPRLAPNKVETKAESQNLEEATRARNEERKQRELAENKLTQTENELVQLKRENNSLLRKHSILNSLFPIEIDNSNEDEISNEPEKVIGCSRK